jgi:hypothetical protein
MTALPSIVTSPSSGAGARPTSRQEPVADQLRAAARVVVAADAHVDEVRAALDRVHAAEHVVGVAAPDRRVVPAHDRVPQERVDVDARGLDHRTVSARRVRGAEPHRSACVAIRDANECL